MLVSKLLNQEKQLRLLSINGMRSPHPTKTKHQKSQQEINIREKTSMVCSRWNISKRNGTRGTLRPARGGAVTKKEETESKKAWLQIMRKFFLPTFSHCFIPYRSQEFVWRRYTGIDRTLRRKKNNRATFRLTRESLRIFPYCFVGHCKVFVRRKVLNIIDCCNIFLTSFSHDLFSRKVIRKLS